MANFGDENNVDGLSDVDDEALALAGMVSDSPKNVPKAKCLGIFAELGRERQAREAAETSKSELQVSFNQLKVLAHEAVKKRDENKLERDEALREKKEALKAVEELSAELFEAVKVREEVIRSKDCLRSEIETAAQMLVIGIDKISGKIINFNSLTSSGLPRSQKYSGLQAVAYGVIKRTNEIVEELLRRIDFNSKSMNEAREQMEQRSYEIAIEFSQLEAAFGGLSEELSKKSSHVERIENYVAGKDERISELEREMLEKQTLADSKVSDLRNLVDEFKEQRSLMVDQLSYVAKIHDQINKVIMIADGDKLERSQSVTSLFLPQDTDMEGNICPSLAEMELIYTLSKSAVQKTRDLVYERNCEVKRLNDAVSQLVKEKDHIGGLLRSAVSRISPDFLSEINEFSKFEESGSVDVASNCKFHNHLGGIGTPVLMNKTVTQMADSLEKTIKQLQLERIDLHNIVDNGRAETCVLKQHVEAQANELVQWKQHIKEIEEKERVANENVEELMMDIAAAEKEITRWKVAAEQEADAGKAVEEDFAAQLLTLRQELEEAKKVVVESEKKLKSKDQIADAAMAARDAAENSLRLADSRTSRIRGKVEELSHQLEQLDSQETSRFGQNMPKYYVCRPRYACWPLQWLRLNFIGVHRPDAQEKSSNEMELSEPLM